MDFEALTWKCLGFFSPFITFRSLHKELFSLERRRFQRNFITAFLTFRGPRIKNLSGSLAIEEGLVVLKLKIFDLD